MLGTSPDLFNATIVKVLRILAPAKIVEFGCGQGKLGSLLRVNQLTPPQGLIGVQPLSTNSDADYLLANGYRNIIDTTVHEFLASHVDLEADLFVAADVFEHLPWSDMISALDQLLYHCKLFLLIHPSKHPQQANGNQFDAHRTSFELIDIANRFEVIYYNLTGFAQISSVHRYHFTLIRGHMNLITYPPMV